MAVDAVTLQGMLQAYIGLNNRFVFSSVLRERNKIALSRAGGEINALKAKSPYLPFVLLVNPKSYTFEGWKQSYSIAQMVDGLSITLQANCEFQTLRISGSSGDLQLIYDNLNIRSGLKLFNSSLPEGFENIFAGNHAIDMQALDGESSTQLLSQFYNVMSVFTNTRNAKIQVMHFLKSWSDEPNVIVDGGSQYYNLKRITIFSAVYPLGKTYHGIIENPFSYTNTAESYREINYDLNFKVIKEAKLDLVNEGVPKKAPVDNSPISQLTAPTPKKEDVVKKSFRQLIDCPPYSGDNPNDSNRAISKSMQIYETFMGIKDWTQDPDNFLTSSDSGKVHGFNDSGGRLSLVDVLKRIGTIKDLESDTPQIERFRADPSIETKTSGGHKIYDNVIISQILPSEFLDRIQVCPQDSKLWTALEGRIKKVLQTVYTQDIPGSTVSYVKIYGVKIPVSGNDYIAVQQSDTNSPSDEFSKSGIFLGTSHLHFPNPTTLIFEPTNFVVGPVSEGNLPVAQNYISDNGNVNFTQHSAGQESVAVSNLSVKPENRAPSASPRFYPR